MNNLPVGDHTPQDYAIPISGISEILKKPIRRVIYPFYNAIHHASLSSRLKFNDFKPNLWMWGQRGNDYERHRRRVAKYRDLTTSNILIAGCGTGKDLESWVRFKPKSITGIDWFSYRRAWKLWSNRFSQISPEVNVQFEQGNLERLDKFKDNSFDIIGSDAVFEHLKNLPQVLDEFFRILIPGGILYATFGPLWYGYGGDHVSGYDAVLSGFNHLLLEGTAYQKYLSNMGKHTHSEDDGRTWIEHDLFSHLRPVEYLECLSKAGFKRRYLGAIIDPRAEICLKNSRISSQLSAKYYRLDLLVSGMTIIFEKTKS